MKGSFVFLFLLDPTHPQCVIWQTREKLELQELTHGRLAMLAFSGMIHQTFVTGKPVLASLGDIFAAP